MNTVFVKKGSSKSYTNLIPSSAPLLLEEENSLWSLLDNSSSLWKSIMYGERNKKLWFELLGMFKKSTKSILQFHPT